MSNLDGLDIAYALPDSRDWARVGYYCSECDADLPSSIPFNCPECGCRLIRPRSLQATMPEPCQKISGEGGAQ